MKTLGVLVNSFFAPLQRRNTRFVVWLCVGTLVLIGIYATVFHLLMAQEGRSYSWITSVYWTVTVMSTLGFGDITFESNIGQLFTILVLVTGATLILIVLPFVFIQFVFRPWMEARDRDRVPRAVRDDVHDHLVLTDFGPVTETLIRRLVDLKIAYVLITPETDDALRLQDLGYDVMVGELDDPRTYDAAHSERAALVVATRSDMTNANIVFTASESHPDVRTVATASSESARQVLIHAGCDSVLRLGRLLGHSMAQRVLGVDARARDIGEFGDLVVAEANVKGTALAGVTIGESELRSRCQVNIVGLWSRGLLELPSPGIRIDDTDVLILVGTRAQLDAYDGVFGLDQSMPSSVVVIGGGRVGRAAAQALDDQGIATRIVELRADRIRDPDRYVHGDAADIDVLRRAGFFSASAVLITTHSDDANIYLTIYCRQLKPDVQIIARSNLERNVATLQRAGADSVLSYASEGATAILNAFGDSDHLVLAEGLEMFSVPVAASIAGETLEKLQIPETTGCNIVGVTARGHTFPNPDPREPIPADASLVVIGDVEGEAKFLERFPLPTGRAAIRTGPRPFRNVSVEDEPALASPGTPDADGPGRSVNAGR